MTQGYIELRKSAARGTDSIAADMMRHLHTRQHLGKAVVVSEQPIAMLSAARKQWLKLGRTIQKQRSSTLNADKILKYTHTITHMQHMQFSGRSPQDQPEADIYFLQSGQLAVMPVQCWSVYVLSPLDAPAASTVVSQLPAGALVVDYTQSAAWQDELGLAPKAELEERVHSEWRQVQHFLQAYDVHIPALAVHDIQSIEAMDEALDTLLGVSRRFLQVAEEFQRALELARPLRLPKDVRVQYDALVLLAHRVQALTPSAFTPQFLQTYNEDDTFFLYDNGHDAALPNQQRLTQALARHQRAGRLRLAQALRQLMEQPRRHAANRRWPVLFPDRS